MGHRVCKYCSLVDTAKQFSKTVVLLIIYTPTSIFFCFLFLLISNQKYKKISQIIAPRGAFEWWKRIEERIKGEELLLFSVQRFSFNKWRNEVSGDHLEETIWSLLGENVWQKESQISDKLCQWRDF